MTGNQAGAIAFWGEFPLYYPMAKEAFAVGGGGGAAPQLTPGTQDIQVTANVIFEIR